MLSFANMLKAPVTPLYDVKPPEKAKRDMSVATEKLQVKIRGRYRLAMEGQVLSTPEIARKLGYDTSAGVFKTLKSFEARGIVRRVPRKAPSPSGKPPVYWTWCEP